MKTVRIPLRIVFYQEEGVWIAHCLEFDLVGDGGTQQEAVECLMEAIRLQVDYSLRHDNLRNLFSPADGELLEMFAAGREVAEGELHIEAKALSRAQVLIESAEAREYVGDAAGETLLPV